MPVNRRGRRYLGIRVFGEGSFTTKEVVDTIQKRVLDFYGARGLSEIEPVLIEIPGSGYCDATVTVSGR